MTGTEFKNELKSLSGVYLFYGSEAYLKRHYLEQVRKTVLTDEGLSVFNHIKLSGADALAGLYNAVRTLPVMADRKLIEVHSLPYANLKAEELKGLCETLREADGPENVIILYASDEELPLPQPKKPGAVFKALADCAKPVEFSKQTPAKLAVWVHKHFESEGISADGPACLMLCEFCACQMSTLASEIKKLCEYLKQNGRSVVTKEDVQKVCCRIEEIAAFDFANAILQGNRDRALTILRDMEYKKQKPQTVLANIASVYGDLYRIKTLADCGKNKKEIAAALKIHEYRVGLYLGALRGRNAAGLSDRIKACCEADLKIKSTPLAKFDLLAGLIV